MATECIFICFVKEQRGHLYNEERVYLFTTKSEPSSARSAKRYLNGVSLVG